MHKFFLINLLVLGLHQTSMAQNEFSDSTEGCFYWTKRGITEFTNDYISDYIIIVGEGEKVKQSEEELFFITKDLVTPIQKYNNKNQEFNIRSNQIFENYKDVLLLIGNLIQNYTSSNEVITVSNAKQRDNGLSYQSVISFDKGLPWFYTILTFLLGLILGCFLIVQYSKIKTKSILDKENYYVYLSSCKKRYPLGYLSILSFLYRNYKENNISDGERIKTQETLQKLQGSIRSKEGEILELREENISLGLKLDELKGLSPNYNYQGGKRSKDALLEYQKQERAIKSVYFSMPEPNGSFQFANSALTNDGKKYYRIDFEENSNKGNLHFLSSERDQRAINRLDSYLTPACKILNIIDSPNASRVQMKEIGAVKRTEDGWQIDPDKKVVIKLI